MKTRFEMWIFLLGNGCRNYQFVWAVIFRCPSKSVFPMIIWIFREMLFRRHGRRQPPGPRKVQVGHGSPTCDLGSKYSMLSGHSCRGLFAIFWSPPNAIESIIPLKGRAISGGEGIALIIDKENTEKKEKYRKKQKKPLFL